MAVTGLMGRHIPLRALPHLQFYGQPFCEAIEAYLAASDMWERRAGPWAMLFAALPHPYYFALHSVLPRAAYIEISLLSLLLMWMAFHLAHRQRPWWLYLLYGLAAGVGFCANFLIAYALVASALYLVLADWRLLLR